MVGDQLEEVSELFDFDPEERRYIVVGRRQIERIGDVFQDAIISNVSNVNTISAGSAWKHGRNIPVQPAVIFNAIATKL